MPQDFSNVDYILCNLQHQNVTRMNSYDHVRKIVQEEGRTARNLVIYNVPVRQHTGMDHYQFVQP